MSEKEPAQSVESRIRESHMQLVVVLKLLEPCAGASCIRAEIVNALQFLGSALTCIGAAEATLLSVRLAELRKRVQGDG